MQDAWQRVFDRFSYGIYLVSIVMEGKDNATIASWVTQCSHEPPLVAVAIRKGRLSHDQILQVGAFTISPLPRPSLGLIRQFKIPDWQHKFDGLECVRSSRGAAVPADSIGWLDCVLETRLDIGDHTLFIGRVVAGEFLHEGAPLSTADYGGAYRGDR